MKRGLGESAPAFDPVEELLGGAKERPSSSTKPQEAKEPQEKRPKRQPTKGKAKPEGGRKPKAPTSTSKGPTSKGPTSKGPTSKGSKAKGPAAGMMRTSVDLPVDLHEEIRIAAVRSGRPLREIFEQSLKDWLGKS